MTRWKPAVGFEVLVIAGNEIVQFRVDIGQYGLFEFVEIDIAGAHDGGRIAVIYQRKQQMLERRIFMVAFIGER